MHSPRCRLSAQDITKLTPLSPEVISRQATINIGTIGHVAHGKSTLVKAISGVQTVRFKNELERNITIKLGYANAKIYRCDSKSCPRLGSYRSYCSSKEDTFPCERPGCNGTMRLERHVSFVDCPGHDILMATMLNGAAVMDAALLLIGEWCVRVCVCVCVCVCLCVRVSMCWNQHTFPSHSHSTHTLSRKRVVPPATDIGAPCGDRDYEAAAHSDSAEQD
jgi:hypothetical protein